MNPLFDENKHVKFDHSAKGSAKQKPEKNPYKVVARKESATAMVPLPPRPMMEIRPPKSLINQNILEALADDPDPAASLAGIRKLLVGPTRTLHDAMFEELVTILEESDHDVQRALNSLEVRWENMQAVSDNLIAEAETIRTHAERLSDYVKVEMERIENACQVKLSEMFLAVDSKIEKIAGEINRQMEGQLAKHANDLQQLTADLEQKNQVSV